MRETIQITDACEENFSYKESIDSAKSILKQNGYHVVRVLLDINTGIAWAHVGKV